MMSTNPGNFDVLIVDDYQPMRAALRALLQSAYPGVNILEAADGARALELCLSHRPRLVLMDIELPDANGIELTARIKAKLPECNVIVVSQHSASIYVERAHEAGAYAYITKGTAHQELLPAVAGALASGAQP
ncbi:MAG: response regulator transcription factor [Sulfuricaulis sp.]|nr:response regulator transcription factor [Sulfuricaulis sp.]